MAQAPVCGSLCLGCGRAGFAATLPPISMPGVCGCGGCDRCSPPCQTPSQSGVRFADYCKACHTNHLCPRCESNAIASSSVDSFCSTCLSTRSSWCSCTGCKVHGGHHTNQCPQNKQKASRFAGYCKRCAPHWKCPSCTATLPHAPSGGLLLSCKTCRPSQCLCPSCANHVPANARCTAIGSLDSGGYCSICAPAWRCSCSAGCPNHSNRSQCPMYVSSTDRRSVSPGEYFAICVSCALATRYCTCKDQGCRHHFGSWCDKRQNVGKLCHGCVPRECHCTGCRACAPNPCTRPADYGREAKTCLPCARGQVHHLASAHSWNIKFPCETVVNCIRDVLSVDLSNLTGSRLVRTRALLKVCRSRLFSEAPDVAMESPTMQTFVMLRPAASNEWSCFDFHYFWYNHCVAKRRTDVCFFPELTSEDFRALGDTLSLPYGGTFRHCHGDVANFASVLEDVPHYPFDIPARLRPTYWKLRRACGAEDLIPASLDSLLLSVVHCVHGQSDHFIFGVLKNKC